MVSSRTLRLMKAWKRQGPMTNTDLTKRDHAIRLIQQRWKEVYYNPAYQTCRKRLLREFNRLSTQSMIRQ